MTRQPFQSSFFRAAPAPALAMALAMVALALTACPGRPKPDGNALSWADELSAPDTSAGGKAAGSRAWVAVPDGAGLRWTLATADAAGAWRDPLGRVLEIPVELVHEISPPDAAAAAEAHAVLLDGETLTVGLPGSADGLFRVDWNGHTKEVRADAAWPLSQGSPWRLYTDEAGRRMRGIEVASKGQTVWLVNGAGLVDTVSTPTVPGQSVEAQLITVSRAPGDAVQAYDWAHGLRPGTVLGQDPSDDLRVLVELEDTGAAASYFFADLVTP